MVLVYDIVSLYKTMNHIQKILLGLLLPVLSHAGGMQDEIQVYTDDINAPGENGLELHVNATPSGITQPNYPGALTNAHGVRFTPELSRGLTRTTELGLYLPSAYTSEGKYQMAGMKLRLKWLPIQAEENAGYFAGMNFELGVLKPQFSESAKTAEIRNILGWKNSSWLIAVNPIFDFNISPGLPHTPTFMLATKLNRRLTESVWIGWEHYNDRGPYNNALPPFQQSKMNFLVMDYVGQPFDFNVGIGKGATANSDRWTVKAIIDVPIND